jgi:hypothetical protein
METVVSGSRIETFGLSRGEMTARFSRVASSVMTVPPFISEPVAGSVSTTASGRAASGTTLPRL